MTKFIKKFNKNYFGVILDLFPLNLGKNFPQKKKALTVCFFAGFTPCKAKQPLKGMELQEKEAQND